MPFPNEHSCRLADPDQYEDFRRENEFREDDGRQIDAILGILEDGSTEVQALRYPIEDWSADAAESHCTSEEGILFEEAEEDEEESESSRTLPVEVRTGQNGEVEEPEPAENPHPATGIKYAGCGGRQGMIKDVDLDARQVRGYWNAFGNQDADNDIIHRGAFADTIRERGPEGSNRVKVLWHHHPMELIGRPLELEEDEMGLLATYEIADTQRGRDTLQLIKQGAITEHSVGISLQDWEIEDGVRHVHKVDLWEGSPVVWGANPRTPVLDVGKSGGAGFARTLEQLQDGLRQCKLALRSPISEDMAETFALQLARLEDLAKGLTEAVETKAETEPYVKDHTNSRALDKVREANETLSRITGENPEENPRDLLRRTTEATQI